MKYVLDCDFRFVIEADNDEEALKKGWDFIYSNLPKCFDTEGSEITYSEIIEENGQVYHNPW